MKQQYIDLAERCEAAEAGSRELDAELWCALFGPDDAYVKQSPYNGEFCVYQIHPGGRESIVESKGRTPKKLPFSTNLDAALMLLPDRHILLHLGHVHIDGDSEAVIGRSDSQSFKGDGSTPALALLAAICRAMGEG
jgi:hypothetical protein